jgi:hypothetical protein
LVQPPPEDALTGWFVAAAVLTVLPVGELAGDREQAATTANNTKQLTMS